MPHSPALVVCRVSEVWCRLRLVWAALGGLILLLLPALCRALNVAEFGGDELAHDERRRVEEGRVDRE